MNEHSESGVPERDRIVARFEAWLDETLHEEAPPVGIAAELLGALSGRSLEDGDSSVADAAQDDYTLWSAMTALTHEVGLQGRAFKQLGDSLAPLREIREKLDASLEAHVESLAEAKRLAYDLRHVPEQEEREIQREAENRTKRSMLDILLDLRERLARNSVSAEAHAESVKARLRRRWLMRWRQRTDSLQASADSLAAGGRLILEQIEDTLRRLDIHEIACKGQHFDPEKMVAADVKVTDVVAEGTVIDVYRPGYEWRGELYRPAHVLVARAPRPTI